MSKLSWRDIPLSDSIDWLLEEDNPSVRFFTLVDILDKPPENREVVKAKQNIMKDGVVPKILAKQKEGGYWEKAEDFYIRTKFKGTVISKQNVEGRWILENTYNGRFQVNIEQKGKPSKWITLNALRTLKQTENLLS